DLVTGVQTCALPILVLTLIALVCHFGGFRPSFWKSMNDFGFFPNRNQTGDVLALGGIVLLALTAHRIVHHLKCAPVWLAGYAARSEERRVGAVCRSV